MMSAYFVFSGTDDNSVPAAALALSLAGAGTLLLQQWEDSTESTQRRLTAYLGADTFLGTVGLAGVARVLLYPPVAAMEAETDKKGKKADAAAKHALVLTGSLRFACNAVVYGVPNTVLK